MAKIEWSELAVFDLQSIYDYISEDSEVYAIRLINKFVVKVEVLDKFPNSGRIVPEFNANEIRELIEGNYRIIYRIEDIEKNISILRIHHAARILK